MKKMEVSRVNELNRKEYDQKKEILISYSPSKLLKKGEEKLFNCGYLFLQSIYYNLGLDKICRDISSRHSFDYNLNDILSKLIYTRILFPFSKLSSNRQAAKFIEQPTLKPLEKKAIRDYGLEQIIVCTDAGLSSKTNGKFNFFFTEI